MSNNLKLFIFIDSYGYELIKKHGVLLDELSFSKPLKMQFGYSSTAIPSILTGRKPSEHGQFTFFYRAENGHSIFRFFDSFWFKLIPSFISKRRKFRVLLSKILKSKFNISGYFDLYAVDFENLKYFNYSEMNDLFAPGAFTGIKNLKDVLVEKNVSHFISDWRKTEDENFEDLKSTIQKRKPNFIFSYFAGLDGIQHMHTKDGDETVQKLNYYKEKITEVLEVANANYSNVEFAIFSDHGMTTLKNEVDILPILKSLNLEFGNDILYFIDSTMARIWYLNKEHRNRVRNKIISANVPGRFLSVDEMREWGILFEDGKYGDDIFLAEPGIQFNPSDMGNKALPGMHGYDPSDDDSNAIWASNYRPKVEPMEVKDIFQCMEEKISELIK